MIAIEQWGRLALEEKLIGQYFSDFQVYDHLFDTYIEGWAHTNGDRWYTGRITLPADYPFAMPRLYVLHRLWTCDGRELSTLGVSHAFHVLGGGPNGGVEICHTKTWEASRTCVQVLVKLVTWLEALEAHWITGKDLGDFLCG